LRPTRMATPASPLVPVLAPTNPPATLGSTHQSLILVATSTPVARAVVTTTVTATVSSALPAPIATAGTLPLSLVATPTVTETVAQPATILIRPNINANARQAPITTAPILRVLAGGTSWRVLSISPDRQWVQVQLPDQVRGWVAMQLVLEQAANVPTPMLTPTHTSVVSAEPAALAVTPTPRLLFTTAITHRVDATETLATIAERYYGNQSLWRLIYEANRTAIGDDPNAIPVGAALVIPPPP
jgi:nucleoid-associated protein YgaU